MLWVDQQGRASSFLNRFYWFGVVGLCTPRCLISSKGQSPHFSIRLYWFGVVWLCILGVAQWERASVAQQVSVTLGPSQQGASSFPNMLILVCCSRVTVHLGSIRRGVPPYFSIGYTGVVVVALCTWAQLAREGLLISQKVILIQCSRALYTWGLISRGGPPHFSIDYTGLVQWVALYTWGLDQQGKALLISQSGYFGLVQQGSVHLGLISKGETLWCSRAMYTQAQWGVDLHCVCEYFSIGSTGLVQQGFVDWGFIRRGGPPHFSIVYFGLVQYGSVHQCGVISRGGPPQFSIGYTGLLQQVPVHFSLISRGETLWCSRAMYIWLNGGSICNGYVNISQQVLLVWCSRTPYTWGHSGRGGPPHFLIGYAGLVQQGSVHLGSICRRQGLPISQSGYTGLVQQVTVHLGLISRKGSPHFSVSYFGLVQQGYVPQWQLNWVRASSFLNMLYWYGVIDFSTIGVAYWGRASVVQQGSVSLEVQLAGENLLISQQVILALDLVWPLYTYPQLAKQGFLISQQVLHGLLQQVTVHLGCNQQGRSSSFLNRLYWLGVVRSLYTMGQISRGETLWCNRPMYTWAQWGFHLHWVSEYFSIGSTGMVQQASVHLGLLSRGGPRHFSIGYTALVQQCSVHLVLISRKGPPHFSISYFALVQQGSVHLGFSLAWQGLLISQQVILVWCSMSSVSLGLQLVKGQLPHFSINYTSLVQYGLCTLGVDQQGRASSFLNR